MVRGLFSVGGIIVVMGWIHLSLRASFEGFGVREIAEPAWQIDAAYQRGFRSEAISQLNRIRQGQRGGEIRGDETLQSFLTEWVAARGEPAEMELDGVFDAIQDRFPGAQYLAANLVAADNREDLLASLAAWPAAGNPDFDSVTTAVFPAGHRLGALIVMARRIPEFSLRSANERGGRYHNRCPHCDKVHALELDSASRTLILSCPYCELPFDLLAVDTAGRIRRATEFLEGFAIPGAAAATGLPTVERLVELWRQVAGRCHYELDQDRPGLRGAAPREVWKSSSETWFEAAGDCEDSSILLADLLVGAGIEARVAIGWNGNIGQHAWVVARLDGRQYLLETTLQKEIGFDDLVEVGRVSDFYQPEQLFDGRRIYYTTARPDRFGSDYFSEEVWKPIPREESLSQR